MKLNALNLYLHPSRSLRMLREGEVNKAQLQRRNDQRSGTARILAECRHKIKMLEEEITVGRAEVQEVQVRLLRKEKEREKIEVLLEQERDETFQAMEEITRRLEEVQAMRDSYERRLSHLRHALADARCMLNRQEDYAAMSEMVVIEPEEPPAELSPKPKIEKKDIEESPKSWLESLPDF